MPTHLPPAQGSPLSMVPLSCQTRWKTLFPALGAHSGRRAGFPTAGTEGGSDKKLKRISPHQHQPGRAALDTLSWLLSTWLGEHGSRPVMLLPLIQSLPPPGKPPVGRPGPGLTQECPLFTAPLP